MSKLADRFTAVAGAAALAIALALPARAAEPAPLLSSELRGRWTTEAGDIVEFRQLSDASWACIVTKTAPQGLGRFFTDGAAVVQQLTLAGGALRGVAEPAEFFQNPTPDLNELFLLEGDVTGAIDVARGAIELTWKDAIRREHLRDELFVDATEVLPFVLALRRMLPPAKLAVSLVRGGQFEPASALFHGLPYVVEFTSADPHLPASLTLQVLVGDQQLPLDASVVSEDGDGRHYRSKPFTLVPEAPDGPPPPG